MDQSDRSETIYEQARVPPHRVTLTGCWCHETHSDLVITVCCFENRFKGASPSGQCEYTYRWQWTSLVSCDRSRGVKVTWLRALKEGDNVSNVRLHIGQRASQSSQQWIVIKRYIRHLHLSTLPGAYGRSKFYDVTDSVDVPSCTGWSSTWQVVAQPPTTDVW